MKLLNNFKLDEIFSLENGPFKDDTRMSFVASEDFSINEGKVVRLSNNLLGDGERFLRVMHLEVGRDMAFRSLDVV